MRPVLIALALTLLVTMSLAVGVLAADWPFWQRAWRWHAAEPGWPARLPGAHAVLRPAGPVRELPLDVDAAVTAAVSPLLDDDRTLALLVAQDDRVLFEYYGAGADGATRLDGRELSRLPLVLLQGAASLHGGGPELDGGIGEVLEEWREDPRGRITPRQLLQGLSGLERPEGTLLDPFGRRARLLAGPDFERAALRHRAAWPPGSNARDNPADAQLVAAALARAQGKPLATLLQDWLLTPLGADSVRVLLDRHRGSMAAHCCVQARGRDWLLLGLLLARDGEFDGRRYYGPGFAQALRATSPVAPDRGLGLQPVGLASGSTALLARGQSRLLLADPATRSAWLWFRDGTLDDAAARRLLQAAQGIH